MSRRQQKAVMAKLNPSRGISRYPRAIRSYKRTHDYFSDEVTTPLKEIRNLIENNPEEAEKLLVKVALWGGCAAAPELCPILNYLYLVYKGGRMVYNFTEEDLKSDDFELLKMIYTRNIKEERLENISPVRIQIMGRKAEYVNVILNNLEQHTTTHLDQGSMEEALISIVLRMNSKSFLSSVESKSNFLEFSKSFEVDENILFEVFEDTLRKNDLDLYAKLLVFAVEYSI